MQRTLLKTFPLFFTLILLAGCAVSENFRVGRYLADQDRPEEAIVHFEAAVRESPRNKTYQEALRDARRRSAADRLERARKTLEASQEPDVATLERLLADADAAARLDPSSREVTDFRDGVKARLDALLERVKTLYAGAGEDIRKEDWTAARARLLLVGRLSPDYEETASRLEQVNREGAKQLFLRGLSLSVQEDWRGAARVLKAALEMNPNDPEAAGLYKTAAANDNAAWFLAEGEKADRARQWDRAVFCYRRALEYEPSNQDLAKRLENLKVKAGQIFFDEAERMLGEEKLNPAVGKIEAVRLYLPSMQDEPIFQDLLARTVSRIVARGDQYGGRGLWGNALMWYEKAKVLAPSDPGLSAKIREARDRIERRIRKTVAVFDFSNPGDTGDTGRTAADRIEACLLRDAGGDIRLFEREKLRSSLEEIRLDLTGPVDAKSVRLVRIFGIDAYVVGIVLKAGAARTDGVTSAQVRGPEGEEEDPNPERQASSLADPAPAAGEEQTAPSGEVEGSRDRPAGHRQGRARIEAVFDATWRLVDAATGEDILADAVEGRLAREDSDRDGAPEANLSRGLLPLPTEAEVLAKLTGEKSTEMCNRILNHFRGLEADSFQAGERFRERFMFDEAVEKYVDALCDARLKGAAAETERQSLERIEALLREM